MYLFGNGESTDAKQPDIQGGLDMSYLRFGLMIVTFIVLMH